MRNALLFFTFASSVTLLPTVALAGLSPCPASLGGYTATVTGSSVVICPTAEPRPGDPASGCPYTPFSLARIDVATGATVALAENACVPAPANAGSATTSCYEDECVPPGTYQYGYGVRPWAQVSLDGCGGTCVGPTSWQDAIVVTVASPLSDCTATLGDAGAPFVPPLWSSDAGAPDGAVTTEMTCCAPNPAPNGALCAATDDDCTVYWGPCPEDGGTADCIWEDVDGGKLAAPCPGGIDAGSTSLGDASSGGSDGAATGTTPPSSGATSNSGGGSSKACAVAEVGSSGAGLAPLLAVCLSFGVRVFRKRRAAGRSRAAADRCSTTT